MRSLCIDMWQDDGSFAPTQPIARYQLFGVTVEVNAPAHLMPRIAHRLPPIPHGMALPARNAHQDPAAIRVYEIRQALDPPSLILRIDWQRAYHGPDEMRVLDLIQADAKLWVAATTSDVCFVHAGVVAWEGAAVVLPGASHAGKTTLVAQLIRAGATFYSDDLAVIDPHGLVWPFPQPLALRQPDGTRLLFDSAALGADTGTTGLPIGKVISTKYRAGAVFQPRSMTPGEVVLTLLENAPAARIRPAVVLDILTRATRGARGLAGARGEAATMVECALGRMQSNAHGRHNTASTAVSARLHDEGSPDRADRKRM